MSANETEPTAISTGEAAKSILDDYPDVDGHSCQLLGPTALVGDFIYGNSSILQWSLDCARLDGGPGDSVAGVQTS